MTRNDFDDFEEDAVPPPRRVSVAEQRSMTGAPSTWVDARPTDRAEIVPSTWSAPAPLERVAGEIVRGVAEAPAQSETADAWRPLPTVREIGTPRDRAWATLIRAAPLVALALPATAGLVWLLNADLLWLLPLWGGLSIVGYLVMLWVDLQWNAPSAVERHRVNVAGRLEAQKMKQDHELKRTIVEAWLRYVERKE